MPSLMGQGISGFRAETPDNLILDAGVMYHGIDETALTAAGSAGAQLTAALADAIKFGATRGGTNFNSGKNIREIAADGIRFPIKGMERVDDAKPTLTTMLLEQTRSNMELELSPGTTTSHTNWDAIEGSVDISDDDYIDNVAVLATLSGSDIPVILVLRNCLVKNDSKLDLKDKTEMAVEAVFTAHALASAPYDCPYTCYYPTTGNVS